MKSKLNVIQDQAPQQKQQEHQQQQQQINLSFPQQLQRQHVTHQMYQDPDDDIDLDRIRCRYI